MFSEFIKLQHRKIFKPVLNYTYQKFQPGFSCGLVVFLQEKTQDVLNSYISLNFGSAANIITDITKNTQRSCKGLLAGLI